MARPLRVEFPNATYHVMARGNERRAVYRDDTDRRRFLETLGAMGERFGVRLHAYCLMPNHYHLLLDTPRANLSQAVGWVAGDVHGAVQSAAPAERAFVSGALKGAVDRGRRVRQMVRRLEQRSVPDGELRRKLERIKTNLSRVQS